MPAYGFNVLVRPVWVFERTGMASWHLGIMAPGFNVWGGAWPFVLGPTASEEPIESSGCV